MSQSKDKRRHPRVAQRIKVRSSSREAVELETIDLSAGGFSCTAPAFLPLMTKLALSLVLPTDRPSATDKTNGHETVTGEAVVVPRSRRPRWTARGRTAWPCSSRRWMTRTGSGSTTSWNGTAARPATSPPERMHP